MKIKLDKNKIMKITREKNGNVKTLEDVQVFKYMNVHCRMMENRIQKLMS